MEELRSNLNERRGTPLSGWVKDKSVRCQAVGGWLLPGVSVLSEDPSLLPNWVCSTETHSLLSHWTILEKIQALNLLYIIISLGQWFSKGNYSTLRPPGNNLVMTRAFLVLKIEDATDIKLGGKKHSQLSTTEYPTTYMSDTYSQSLAQMLPWYFWNFVFITTYLRNTFR